MKSPSVFALVLALIAPVAQARVNVIATTPDLAAIAREVGGGEIEVTSLARPTEDAHYVDPKPSFIARLNRADALLEGGLELEAGWLEPLIAGARNPKLDRRQPGRVFCAEGVAPLEVPATVDRSQGHVHATGNPHFLMDPANAKIVARNLANALAQIAPRSADLFKANAENFSAAVDARLAAWHRLLDPHRGQRVVAYHNSWPYFSRQFGVKVDLFLEPKPGIPPSPAHLAAVVAKMKAEKIRVIFTEPHVSRKTADTVARNSGATVVEVTQYPGGLKGTEAGYLALMDHNVRALANALSVQ